MKEIIRKGFEEFKSKEPYPHIDKDSFEKGAEFMLNWACEWLKNNLSTYTVWQSLDEFKKASQKKKTT